MTRDDIVVGEICLTALNPAKFILMIVLSPAYEYLRICPYQRSVDR